jgi:hypothetical protein
MNAQKILIDDIAEDLYSHPAHREKDVKKAIVKILRRHLVPLPELADCVPCILYFPNHAEADAFMELVKQVKPNMEERQI